MFVVSAVAMLVEERQDDLDPERNLDGGIDGADVVTECRVKCVITLGPSCGAERNTQLGSKLV